LELLSRCAFRNIIYCNLPHSLVNIKKHYGSGSKLHLISLLGYLLIVKIHNKNGYRRHDVLSPSPWQAERHAKLKSPPVKALGGFRVALPKTDATWD
jgi:hypothetical protein